MQRPVSRPPLSPTNAHDANCLHRPAAVCITKPVQSNHLMAMKLAAIILPLFLLAFAVNAADTNTSAVVPVDPAATNTIVTIDGTTYHRAKVVCIWPDGLSVRYFTDSSNSAGARIALTNLPVDYQKKYGPDIQNQANEIKHEEELKERIKKTESENVGQAEKQKAIQNTPEPETKSSDSNLRSDVRHWISNNIDHGAFLLLENDSVWEIYGDDVARTKEWIKSASIVGSKTTAVAIGYTYTLTNTDEHENAHAKYVGYANRWIRENRGHGWNILMEDKSLYQPAPFDKMTALVWSPQDKMATTKSDSLGEYDFILINADQGEMVHAKLIGWEY